MLRIPDAYLSLIEDIRHLCSDENNPNLMSIKQKDQVWRSLQKYGWAYPIIVNKDGVFADGEQRAQVCMEHDEFFVPVLWLPVSDVDRRLLRQILNKLKGRHSRELDEAEYGRIIEAGEKNQLEALLRAVGEKLPEGLGGPNDVLLSIPESYELLIECRDEGEQKVLFERFC